MSKYAFVPGDEIVIAPGRTAERIRSPVAISHFVAPGSLDGYIETIKNLHVSSDALVFGNARVHGGLERCIEELS